MDKICIYLRKSRADEDLERTLGQGETLRKHRKALLKFAKDKQLNIVEIKEEIVSGDSLFFRPKMLELLKEVENNMYYGVLVMDIDRLGRGGMKDQGIILEAFKESNTKIITPMKTYDLDNEMDEEMTEFKTFFSRRELKSINRRMQGGRVRSVEEGNYIATNPPYGYDIEFIQKSRTLKINEIESNIVKIIFNMYIEGEGATSISNYLNSIDCKTKAGNKFSPSSVLSILKNPVYIGKVTWKKKDIKKSKDPNKVKDTRTRDKSEWIISEGKHKGFIDEKVFNTAQDILKNKYHIPYQLTNAPVNPFAGILECGICGKKMTMRKLRGIPRVLCTNKCGNKSVRFDYFETAVLNSLEDHLTQYRIAFENESEHDNDKEIYTMQVNSLTKELNVLNNQKFKLFDLLERGIYKEDIFLQRSMNIDDRIKNISNEINRLNLKLDKINRISIENTITVFANIIEGYKQANDIKLKNRLLKEILYKIEYTKEPHQKNREFEIKLYPKLVR